jgi:hypothetical protein
MRLHKGWMAAVAFAILAGSGASALGQDKPAPKVDVIIEREPFEVRVPAPAAPLGAPGITFAGRPGADNLFVFVSSEMSFDGKVVKGAPYSAEAITETVQTLADGNRIVRKNSATIYRDNDGRTRREQTLSNIGWMAPAPSGEPVKTVFINDPVAGINYTLDLRSRTARKIAFSPNGVGFMAPPLPPGVGPNVMVYENAGRRRNVERQLQQRLPAPEVSQFKREPKTEALGKQSVEGVEAEGTRTTITIPAGEIGNERPIEIISERWYSPELQTVVLHKNIDPLVGETTYRLTNINRADQPRTLFEVPGDYQIKDSPAPQIFRRTRRPENE